MELNYHINVCIQYYNNVHMILYKIPHIKDKCFVIFPHKSYLTTRVNSPHLK